MFCLGFKYLAARLALLARQWMKERGRIYMCVKSVVYIFSGSFGSANKPNEPAHLWMLKSGPVFCTSPSWA